MFLRAIAAIGCVVAACVGCGPGGGSTGLGPDANMSLEQFRTNREQAADPGTFDYNHNGYVFVFEGEVQYILNDKAGPLLALPYGEESIGINLADGVNPWQVTMPGQKVKVQTIMDCGSGQLQKGFDDMFVSAKILESEPITPTPATSLTEEAIADVDKTNEAYLQKFLQVAGEVVEVEVGEKGDHFAYVVWLKGADDWKVKVEMASREDDVDIGDPPKVGDEVAIAAAYQAVFVDYKIVWLMNGHMQR